MTHLCACRPSLKVGSNLFTPSLSLSSFFLDRQTSEMFRSVGFLTVFQLENIFFSNNPAIGENGCPWNEMLLSIIFREIRLSSRAFKSSFLRKLSNQNLCVLRLPVFHFNVLALALVSLPQFLCICRKSLLCLMLGTFLGDIWGKFLRSNEFSFWSVSV